jgi:hypothetical protein
MRPQRKFASRLSLVSVVAALSLAAGASPATASVTVGQTASAPPSGLNTCDLCDLVQATLASGISYVIPADGTLTSWSTYANPSGGRLEMKIYRHVSGNTYMAVTHEGPRTLTPNVLNTFTGLSVQVKAGDVLGDGTPADAGGPAAIFQGELGDQNVFRDALADGESGAFMNDDSGFRVNISAVIDPTTVAPASPTGQRDAAIKKCKKKHKGKAQKKKRKKCIKKATKLPA